MGSNWRKPNGRTGKNGVGRKLYTTFNLQKTQGGMVMYNYYEAVKEDVLNYIKEEVDMNGMDLDELKERLWEDLINNDSVTRNVSGSYTSCWIEAEKYVEENKDLVREMCDEFGGHQRIANWWLTDDYELIDVSLRCYVLENAIEMAVEELETAAE